MMKRTIVFMPFFLAALAGHATESSPNIVVLLSDDLGFKDIGCYDGPVRTPTLDGLAANGIRFTDFYSGCAVCSPSRATLLTGRHHLRTGVYSWINDDRERIHLLEREVTLAELLRSAGYATAHFGKWHLGLPTARRAKPTPAEHGFDYWFATSNNADPSHRNPENFIRNGAPVGKIEGYSCQIVVDEALAWLDRHRPKDRPFFLNVWFHEPHGPRAAPDDIVAQYGSPDDIIARYSGTIDNSDRAVARLLARLKEIAPAGDTLIIYASDNGSLFDAAGRTGHLRGNKGTNWDGGIRVPGIFVWPGKIPAGRVEQTPAGLVDVLPTICGLLGIDPPAGVHLDGSDLSPLLRAGRTEPFIRHQPLFWHLYKSRPMIALRDGRYSLVADPDYELSTDNNFQDAWISKIKTGGYTNFRVYDLLIDPSQKHDIGPTKPELLARLRRKMILINDSIMADAPDWHLDGP